MKKICLFAVLVALGSLSYADEGKSKKDPEENMAGSQASPIKHQFFDANGDPASGYQLFVYLAGGATKTDSYTDSALTTANTNPIVLDAAGRADIFLDETISYKFVLAPPTDADPPTAPVWTVDGTRGPAVHDSHALTRLYSDSVSRANVNTDETDLGSYTIPGGTLATDGQIIKAEWAGTLANNANVKTLKVYLGSTKLCEYATGAAIVSWRLQLSLIRSGAAAAFSVSDYQPLAAAIQTAAPAETLANDLELKLTATSDTASNDITEKMMVVELLP